MSDSYLSLSSSTCVSQNTDIEHTVSLAKEDYAGAIIEDVKTILQACPTGEDGGLSGEMFHNSRSWSVKFGAIGAGSC